MSNGLFQGSKSLGTSKKVTRLSESFRRRTSCFQRAFNESFHAFGDIARKSFKFSERLQRRGSYFWRFQRNSFNAFGEISTKSIMLSERAIIFGEICNNNVFLFENFTNMACLSPKFANIALRKLCGILCGPREAANFCQRGLFYNLHSMAPFLNCIS